MPFWNSGSQHVVRKDSEESRKHTVVNFLIAFIVSHCTFSQLFSHDIYQNARLAHAYV